MELQRLRAFREVARELSFTRAARNLNYSQPSITAQIKGLEESVGMPLFVRRGNRSIELTPAGARLRPYADRILDLVETARMDLRSTSADRPPAPDKPLTAGSSTSPRRPTRFLIP
ncbi:LysR family transcriptional regulator [Streptomyces sp. ME02-8801-2C]|uniref:LysR family transcriptional regulator n=1 Tax=Streptomyces sp. ME02-8801-2C TaxID=3028680 RepID=UPI0029B3C20C|nr:LysR family transcriptional regulator [Streptomyces sp. ME02-8801-2C]MDX3455657.1 LysR family transcriptional regulator [Streptomyces sp. ME02-8801-2C]